MFKVLVVKTGVICYFCISTDSAHQHELFFLLFWEDLVYFRPAPKHRHTQETEEHSTGSLPPLPGCHIIFVRRLKFDNEDRQLFKSN